MTAAITLAVFFSVACASQVDAGDLLPRFYL
jgi:hypothetical protein